MTVQEYVPLAPFTTLGVGGPARYFVAATSVEEAREALAFAHSRALPVFVLGGGSNIVVADEGFNGLVLIPRMTHVAFTEHEDGVRVTVGAGMIWDAFVAQTVARGFSGIECLSGVPGTIGGAIVANLGAYGVQASDTLESIDVLDCADVKNTMRTFEKKACGFSYHDSMFSHAGGRYIICEVRFKLRRSGEARPSYEGNQFNLAALAATLHHKPTLEEIRAAILRMRADKGTLAESYQSAGSFFHLPFISGEKYAEVVAIARARDAKKEELLRPWAWEQPDGSYKLASGFLLEYTEFRKGYVRGAVGISPKHTLVIINRGSACAQDIVELAHDMQDAVERLFGINLEREVEYVGFS